MCFVSNPVSPYEAPAIRVRDARIFTVIGFDNDCVPKPHALADRKTRAHPMSKLEYNSIRDFFAYLYATIEMCALINKADKQWWPPPPAPIPPPIRFRAMQ